MSTRLNRSERSVSSDAFADCEIATDEEFTDVVLGLGDVLNLPSTSPTNIVVDNLSGNINRVRRVVLVYATGQERNFILKHVPVGGRLERYPTVVFPENRLDFEVAWFQHSAASVQTNDVRTPFVYAYLKEVRLIVMEDFGSSRSFFTMLLNEGPSAGLIEKLGCYLGLVHGHSLAKGAVDNPAAAINRQFVFTLAVSEPETIRTIWRSRAEQASAGESQHLTEDYLSRLIELQENFLGQFAERLKPVLTELETKFKTSPPVVFTHGDLHADSILILPDSQIGIVDAELADTGSASFDLGTLAAHIWAAKAVAGTTKSEIIELMRILFNAYLQSYSKIDVISEQSHCILWQETLLHCGAEMLRRLIGAAGFPFRLSPLQIKHLLDEAKCLLLEPDRIPMTRRIY